MNMQMLRWPIQLFEQTDQSRGKYKRAAAKCQRLHWELTKSSKCT